MTLLNSHCAVKVATAEPEIFLQTSAATDAADSSDITRGNL